MSRADADELDAADVQRVLLGDSAAFAGIVDRWQRRLVNLAWRYCHDRSLAEDMAQDAFVKAFRSLRTFRGESRFSTWLTAIAINSYRSWLRDRQPAAISLEHLRAELPAPHDGDSLDETRRAEIVRRMVATLPPRYREPMILYYLSEMDIGETARTLGLPEGTVKARLHRGREFLRKRLSSVLPDAGRERSRAGG